MNKRIHFFCLFVCDSPKPIHINFDFVVLFLFSLYCESLIYPFKDIKVHPTQCFDFFFISYVVEDGYVCIRVDLIFENK